MQTKNPLGASPIPRRSNRLTQEQPQYIETSTYTGFVENGKYHGFGTLNDPLNNLYFRGEFNNGKIKGFGSKKLEESFTQNSYWHGDVSLGFCSIENSLQFEIMNFYTDPEKGTSFGRASKKSGNYFGSLSDFKSHGYGCQRDASGSVYRGMWKNNNKEGLGFQVECDGRVIYGVWENNDPKTFAEFASKEDFIKSSVPFELIFSSKPKAANLSPQAPTIEKWFDPHLSESYRSVIESDDFLNFYLINSKGSLPVNIHELEDNLIAHKNEFLIDKDKYAIQKLQFEKDWSEFTLTRQIIETLLAPEIEKT